MLAHVFPGPTDHEIFENFIEELLPRCGRWPQPRSVLIMDNASFHRSANIDRMCAAAGVITLYLWLCSPDLNPIEEFFAQLKAFCRRYWPIYRNMVGPDFRGFLQWCVEEVGSDKKSARGHFRHAGIILDEL
jgi:transposase